MYVMKSKKTKTAAVAANRKPVRRKKTPSVKLPKMDETFLAFMKRVSAANKSLHAMLKMNDLRNWLRRRKADGLLNYDTSFIIAGYGKKNRDAEARAIIYLASVYLEPKGECFICKNTDGGRSAFIDSPRLLNEVKNLLREDVDVDTHTTEYDGFTLHHIGVLFPVNRKLKAFGGNRIADVVEQFRLQSKRGRRKTA